MNQVGYLRGECITKIFHDKNGRLIRAKFWIYQEGTRVRARLVNFEYVNELTGNTPLLQGAKTKKYPEDYFSYKKRTTSPYFAKELLDFFGSKPRAPTI